MAPPAFRCHRERGGRSPPSLFFLGLPLDGRRVPPLVHGLHAAERREPLRDWICRSVLFCSAFFFSGRKLFLIFPEIRNSNWIETFAQIFLRKLAFLRQKNNSNRLTGCPRGSGARPLPRGTLGHLLALILLPKNHKYSKKISVYLYSVWTPFDMSFLRNIKHATNRNWHWALDQYVSPKNSIKSCQKYMKIE